MDIHMRKRQSKPAVSAKRNVMAVMDDETYLTLDGKDYFTFPTKEFSSDVKYTAHTKYPKKVLMWLTLSEKGMSRPLLLWSGLTVNGEIYSTKRLPEVAAFIKKYPKDDDFVFWPDLASVYYSKQAQEEMERLGIPPNGPQLHSIEKFWANLKRRE